MDHSMTSALSSTSVELFSTGADVGRMEVYRMPMPAQITVDHVIKTDYEKFVLFKTRLPPGMSHAYSFLLLNTLEPEDTFQPILRKLMFVAAFLFAPPLLGIAAYWHSIASLESGTYLAARTAAAVAAVVCAVGVFTPCWLMVRFGRRFATDGKSKATDTLLNFWIGGILVCFCVMGIAVPRFPSCVAAYALSEAMVLAHATPLLLHLGAALALFAVTTYNLVFLDTIAAWQLLTITPQPHRGGNAENLILTGMACMIVCLMAGALFLYWTFVNMAKAELGELISRSEVTAELSRNVASGLRSFQLHRVRVALEKYLQTHSSDKKLYNEMLSIVGTIQHFAHFVPKEIVCQLLKADGAASLHEAKKRIVCTMASRRMTFFFCDIANFTSISEQITNVDTLVELMSCYFAVITHVGVLHRALTDKFIGDAVMLVWNGVSAPTADGDGGSGGASANMSPHDQSLFSLSMCLHCHGIIQHMLRRKFHETAGVPLAVRMGVHQGWAHSGVLGSRHRLAWTSLGDAVNVASRLEGLNKQFGTTICISDDILATACDTPPEIVVVASPHYAADQAVANTAVPVSSPLLPTSLRFPLPATPSSPFATRRLGVVSVKGRAERLVVHELLGLAPGYWANPRRASFLDSFQLDFLASQALQLKACSLPDSPRTDGSHDRMSFGSFSNDKRCLRSRRRVLRWPCDAPRRSVCASRRRHDGCAAADEPGADSVREGRVWGGSAAVQTADHVLRL